MFVDMETGTILNGPIYFIPLDVEFDCEGLSDSQIVELAREVGVHVDL